MKIRTIPKITLVEARTFEDEQGLKGIKKLDIFSQDDCYWELVVSSPIMKNGFTALVQWFQIQEYETGDPENPIAEMAKLMFRENFTLTPQELDDLFNAVGISIVPPESLSAKFDEIVVAGIIHWVGNVRQIFGLDTSGFEVLEASRPTGGDGGFNQEASRKIRNAKTSL